MVQCGKISSYVVMPSVSSVKKESTGETSDASGKLLHDLEQKAEFAKSQIKRNKPELVSEEEFKSVLFYTKTHMYDSERKDIDRIAKCENGLYDKSVLSLLKELKDASTEENESYASVEVTDIIKFLKSYKNTDPENKEKILKFINDSPDKAASARIMNDLARYSGYNDEIKNKTLDLTIQLHDNYCEQIGLQYDFDSSDATRMLRQFVRRADEGHELERLDKISKVAENTEDIRPLINLINLVEEVGDEDWTTANKLVDKFLDLGIIPTKGTVNKFLKMSTKQKTGDYPSKSIDAEGAEKFFSIMKPLTDLKLDNIYIDEYALDEIVLAEDKTFLNNIIEKVKERQKSDKIEELSIRENSINPSEFRYNICTDTTIQKYMYDKETKSFIGRELIDGNDFYAKIFLTNNKMNKEVKQEIYRDYGLLNETITSYNDQGETENTNYAVTSNVLGHLDIYSQSSDGKIKVLSKSFKDPVTGEVNMKNHFISPNRTKTDITYIETPNGDYSYQYSIKDNSGNYLMNNDRTCNIIDENHYSYNLNGKKYDVLRQDNILTVTKDGERPVEINLDKIVPSGNKKIIETLAKMPADELINIKKLNIVFKVCSDNDNAFALADSPINQAVSNFWGKEKEVVHYINLGDNLSDSQAVILHEIGHIKSKELTKKEWGEIKSIYNKELQAYRKNSTSTEARSLYYLIDTDHYLNESGHGAIEEALSDTNYMLKIPADNNVGDDFVVRGVKFRESFPETIACYNKILEAKKL